MQVSLLSDQWLHAFGLVSFFGGVGGWEGFGAPAEISLDQVLYLQTVTHTDKLQG